MIDPLHRPLDHPTINRPHRVYVALTNHCNRACPWCSTYSSPDRNTWLDPAAFAKALPDSGPFEIQLEGGEPTLHPFFWSFVEHCRLDCRCTRIVLCTNGVALPRTRGRVREYLERLGAPLTLKLSINHHLLERDPGLLALALELRDGMQGLGGDRALILNVRRRKGAPEDDQWIVEEVSQAGLLPYANVFFLQRYGLASNREEWELPFLAGHNFRMVNPDGSVFAQDLVARSEAMGQLP